MATRSSKHPYGVFGRVGLVRVCVGDVLVVDDFYACGFVRLRERTV